MRAKFALAALSYQVLVEAQNTAPADGIPSASQIVAAINSTGIVPPELIDLAGAFLLSAANSTRAAIDAVLRDNPVAAKRDDPELYYSYGRSPPTYPSRVYTTDLSLLSMLTRPSRGPR
jgi:hypothetical protein